MSFLSSTRNCTCATLGHSKGSITFYMEIGSKAKEMLDAFFTLFVGDLVKAVLKHFVEMKWFIITGRHFAWSGVRLLCRQTHTHTLTHSRESLSLFSLSASVIHSKSEKRHKRHVDQWSNRRKKYFFCTGRRKAPEEKRNNKKCPQWLVINKTSSERSGLAHRRAGELAAAAVPFQALAYQAGLLFSFYYGLDWKTLSNLFSPQRRTNHFQTTF